jgi:hypothetical protein
MILENCKTSCGMKLFIVKGHKVCLGFFYFVIHFFGEFLNSVDLSTLTVVNFNHTFFFLLINLNFKSCNLRCNFLLFLFNILQFCYISIEVGDLFSFGFNLSMVVFLNLFDLSSKLCMFFSGKSFKFLFLSSDGGNFNFFAVSCFRVPHISIML